MVIQNSFGNKRSNKSRILSYVLKKGETSKSEIASVLRISAPTVLQNVKDLVDEGMIKEAGAYESTGGRRAKALSVVSGNKYAVGIDITANHISYVLIDLKGNVIHWKRSRQVYEHTLLYYKSVRNQMEDFIGSAAVRDTNILGVGISIPGIIDKDRQTLVRSHSLDVENISLRMLSQYFDQEPAYENDASAAAMAELGYQEGNAVYLSLSDTVGGAIFMNQELYSGDNFRSAEFGHMMIVPDGNRCYCGKKGCVDAYCSAKVLAPYGDGSLELFFNKVAQEDESVMKVWHRYLDDLAVTISNLRMSFDCDIILGGYVGAFLGPYVIELGQRVQQYNRFDRDSSYLHICRYRTEASAVGIAMTFVDRYVEGI